MRIYKRLLSLLFTGLFIAAGLTTIDYPRVSKFLFAIIVLSIIASNLFRKWRLKDNPRVAGEVVDTWSYKNGIVTEIEILFFYNSVEYRLNKKLDSQDAPSIGGKVEVIINTDNPQNSIVDV